MNDDAFWTRIDRYLAGDATPAETAEVERWLAQSPARAELIAAMRPSSDRAWNVDAAWQRTAQRMGQASENAENRRGRATRTSPWLKAAAIAALMVGGFTVWRALSRPAGVAIATSVTVTQAGQRDSVRLADGSLVLLAPESRIESQYDANARLIRLTGEAFFDVVSEPDRPFRVETGSALTEVLGTEFTVRARTDTSHALVAVRAGRVSVRSRNTGDSIVLGAGQVGLAGADTAMVVDARADRWLAWLDGDLEFDNATLAEVLAELERWFATQVRVADASLLERRVTGRFNGAAVGQTLSALALALGVEVRQDSAGWLIRTP